VRTSFGSTEDQLEQLQEQLDRLGRKFESALKQTGQAIAMTAQR